MSEANVRAAIGNQDIYKEMSTRFQSLREIQYKLPGIFSAVIGGLWFFGAGQIEKDRTVAAAVFVFAAASALACINAMNRFRAAFNGYLDKLNEFEDRHAVTLRGTKGLSINAGMVGLLWLAAIMSVGGAIYSVVRTAPSAGALPSTCQILLQQPNR